MEKKNVQELMTFFNINDNQLFAPFYYFLQQFTKITSQGRFIMHKSFDNDFTIYKL